MPTTKLISIFSLTSSLLLSACSAEQSTPPATTPPQVAPEPVVETTGSSAESQENNKEKVAEAEAAKQLTSVEKSHKYLQHLMAFEIADAWAMLDANVQKMLSEEMIAKYWGAEQPKLGALVSTGEATIENMEGFEVVTIPVTFRNKALRFQVAINKEGRISGVHFLPAEEWNPPAYVDATQFEEQEITIGEDPWKLPGTLSMPKPKGKYLAFVLVHGSGPNDRDETIYSQKPFKDLAWGLASRGHIVLRYDKRTNVHGKAMKNLAFTVQEETIDDALHAIAFLKKQPGVRGVVVIGHSQGALVLPRIVKQSKKHGLKIKAAVAMAGPARSLEDVIVTQAEYLSQVMGSSETGQQAVEQMKAVQSQVKSLTAADSSNAERILTWPKSWWLDLRAYRPDVDAKDLKLPLLVLQGQRDYQVSSQDNFALWQESLRNRKNVSFKLFPSLDHLFAPGEGSSVPSDYAKPNHVAVEVLDAISAWIKESRI